MPSLGGTSLASALASLASGNTSAVNTVVQGFTIRGSWAAATAYSANDVVSYAGSSYVAPAAIAGSATFNAASWALLAAAGQTGNTGSQGIQGVAGQGFTLRGAWTANTAYNLDDVVTYLGSSYAAPGAFTSGSAFVAANWLLLASVGATGAAGASINAVNVTTTTLAAGAQATGAGSVSSDGKTLTLTLGLPQGAAGASGTTTSGALTRGSIVQPSAIVTPGLTLATPLATGTIPAFGPLVNEAGSQIVVDSSITYQEFFGVGAALTEASVYVLMTYMTAAQRTALLTEMFGTNGFGFVRVPMGCSDFTYRAYQTYADNGGTADANLTTFSVAMDEQYLIPVLQQILQINPHIRVICTPWTPPVWLKSVASLTSGAFSGTAANFTTYAQYFVKHHAAYKGFGVNVWAYTPQNEPNNGSTGYPCCSWLPADIGTFIGTYLGPAFDSAGIESRIYTADVSWGSLGSYASVPLANTTALPYIAGITCHGYSGNPLSGMTVARPTGTSTLMTEWEATTNEGAMVSLSNLAATMAVTCTHYNSSALILWNLVLDETGAPWQGNVTLPSTNQGSRGLASVNKSTAAVVRFVEFYVFAHLSRFLKPGARRCRASTFVTGFGVGATDVISSGFANKDGSTFVYLYNPNTVSRTVTITDALTAESTVITMAPLDIWTVTWGPGSAVAAGTFTAPSAPQQFTATSGTNAVTYSWTAPAAPGSSDIGGYVLFKGTAAGAENAALPLVVLPMGTLTYTDTTAPAGTAQFAYVKAFGAGGYSPASAEATATATAPAATAPPAPTVTVAAGNTQNVLTISLANNGGAAISSYQINAGTTSGGETALTTISSTALSVTYTHTGLTNGTTEYYTVTATNSAGTSAASTEVSGKPYASIATPTHGLVATGTSGGMTTPASTKLVDTTAALDVRALVNLSSYSYSAAQSIFGNYPITGSNKTTSSFNLCLWSGGGVGMQIYDSNQLYFNLNSADTINSVAGATIQSVVATNTTLWLRAYLNAGTTAITDAAGMSHAAQSAQAYYSTDGTTWVALGQPRPYSGAAGIRQATTGAAFTAFNGAITGSLFKIMATDANNTAFINADMTALASGATSFTDTTSNPWTITSPSSVS